MHDTIRSKAAPQNIDLGGNVCEAHVIPAALIGELKEYVIRGVFVAENPERNHDGEEAEDMANQTGCFELWEKGGAPCVEDNGDNDDSPHDEGNLPRCEGEVGVGHVNAGLHLEGDGIATTCETGEPAKSCHPARRIREDLLILGRREFTNPVLLLLAKEPVWFREKVPYGIDHQM